MLIVTNFERFPTSYVASDGTQVTSVQAKDAASFRRYQEDPEVVFVVNCDPRLVGELVMHRIGRAASPPIVAVDLVLRSPKSARGRARAMVKRWLLRRVDLFIHYFRDVSRLERTYGIRPERSSFVNFKSNLWDDRADRPDPDGAYALCFGRSLRDYDTFFDAVDLCRVPAGIVDPTVSRVWDHGSRFTRPLDDLPKEVSILPDDMTAEAQLRVLRGAGLVVVPIVKGSLVASGISTILNAMALGKCVVASEGPGVSDIFDNELIMVPPEDPRALAQALERAWTDEQLRHRTARLGWEYAMRCGSEEDFHFRVIEEVAARVRGPASGVEGAPA